MAKQGNGATAQPPMQPTPNVPATQGERRPATQPQALKAVLEASLSRLAAALPKGLAPERWVQVVQALNFKTPKLQQCEPASILSAVLQGAALGLDFSPTMGEAYLIPRWNKNIGPMGRDGKTPMGALECQFQPGYRGLAKLARNSGEVTSIQARIVREADDFDYGYRPELVLNHRPYIGDDCGEVVGVYAVARLASGEYMADWMTKKDVLKIQARSDARESGPWKNDWDEMAKKTVIKRLSKLLPMNTELATAIEADNREYEANINASQLAGTPQRGMAGLAGQLGLEETPRPPSPSVLYTEADETSQEEPTEVSQVPPPGAGDAWEPPA